jgi:RHS repeat-associated protein
MSCVNGRVVWSLNSSSFGKAESVLESVYNNLRFPGQYKDQETGLNLNLFRYYNSHIGRYMRIDPIGYNGGINLYSYAMNSPVRYYDPKGLLSKKGTTVAIKLITFFSNCMEISPGNLNWQAGNKLLINRLFGKKYKKRISNLAYQMKNQLDDLKYAIESHDNKIDTHILDTSSKFLNALSIFSSIDNPNNLTSGETADLFVKFFEFGNSLGNAPKPIGAFLSIYDNILGQVAQRIVNLEETLFITEANQFIDCGCCCPRADWGFHGIMRDVAIALENEG